jgi:hypothetical protein
MGEETLEKNKTPNSDISGASGFNPQSVPQLPRVFSYPVEGGYISVYLANAGFEKLAIIAFDDNHREFAYSVETLTSSATNEAYELVQNAEKEFHNPLIANPFTELLNDNEAMTRLIIVISQFLHSGE